MARMEVYRREAMAKLGTHTQSKPTRPTRRRLHRESVAFVSLGCPKNLVDSEKMLGLLTEDGISVTPDQDSADAIVINTCGFLEASKDESLQVIHEAIEHKRAAARKGRPVRVVVAGCLVQRHKAKLLQTVPEIDALIGVFDRDKIVQAVRGNSAARTRQAVGDLGLFHPVSQWIGRHDRSQPGYTEDDSARLRLTPRHYAYLRMSEGCNQGCTFCTIPSIRGRMRSKPLAAILAEARELVDDGAFEINLIGQDTTSYGTDIGYTGSDQGLVGLLNELDRQSGAGWLRLMYAYPSCFTDEMIRAIAAAPRVVKYIDMPLQHINDDILYAMRRKVTRKQIEGLLHKLRSWVPGISIRTTFISGFPGETPAQHKELLAFIKDFEFDCLGVFEYSPEPGTPAGRLWQTQGIATEVAAERKADIMLAQQKIVFKRNKQQVGRELEVLVDRVDPKQRKAYARHAGQAPDIDSVVMLNLAKSNQPAPGEVLKAVVTDWQDYDLIAEPLTLQPIAPSPLKPHRQVRLPVMSA